MTRVGVFVIAALLAACSQEPPAPPRDPDAPPVIVYSAYTDTTYLPALFKAFTDETGIPVVVRHRTDEANLEDMAAKSGSQPADVLLTRSIWSIWQAADEGLLRPMPADSRAGGLAAGLKDPDGLWAALTVREIGIQAAEGVPLPPGFMELADSNYESSLCLSSSAIHQNRVLLAHLVRTFGARDVELAVRGWVKNLVLPPFENEEELQKAFNEGRCGIAIRVGPNNPSFRSTASLMEIEALGIGRHARSPADAARLVDWMLSDAFLSRHANMETGLPATAEAFSQLADFDMAAIGFLYEDAAKLAERARWD